MLMTDAPIDARAAAEWGLVNRVVPATQLREETLALAEQIGKQVFCAQIDPDQARGYDYTKEIMSLNATAQDAQQGIGAFLEKRKPCWSGQ